MEQILSREVRWFFNENLSKELENKLETTKFAGYTWNKETRSDFYLFLPEIETIGVKLRGSAKGNFEIKQRQEILNPLLLDTKEIGRVELWSKSVFGFETNSPHKDVLENFLKTQGSKTWIVVNKTRYLAKFQLINGSKFTNTDPSPDNRPDNGCNLEITKVSINKQGEAWWTLGLEAFGKLEELIATAFQKTVKECLDSSSSLSQSLDPKKFTLANSYSYPSWLNNLGRV